MAGRPPKTLKAHVLENSFRARRHYPLLAGEELPQATRDIGIRRAYRTPPAKNSNCSRRQRGASRQLTPSRFSRTSAALRTRYAAPPSFEGHSAPGEVSMDGEGEPTLALFSKQPHSSDQPRGVRC